ncbi:MAG: hypothetical protein GY809_25875, partial [Planctomycetes bacterium]|nr:hypothetical protein [Planctomycetota bacterium]
MVLVFLGCVETPPQAVTASQDPCVPAPNAPTLESIQLENEQLRQQVLALSNLPEGIGVGDLYHVVDVQLTRFTGLYDDDKDGQIDHLSVYLRPVDADGDVVKAAGHVTVQLWDLSGENTEALLSEWKISSEDLRKEWFSSLMTVNYRLRFPLQAQWADPALSLTVRVLFKDYLTGEELTSQKPVKART